MFIFVFHRFQSRHQRWRHAKQR